MPAVEAVQTFVGITNENEFFSHHYLAEVFQGNIKETLEQWNTGEQEDEKRRSPVKVLAGCAKNWFLNRGRAEKVRDPQTLLELFRERHQALLKALGWDPEPREVEIRPGVPLPSWQVLRDARGELTALVMPAYRPGEEESDPLAQTLDSLHYGGIEVPETVKERLCSS